MSLRDLPTLTDTRAMGRPVPKGLSRLEARAGRSADRLRSEIHFKREVWTRDHWRCRCCKQRVIKSLARVPNRGEVHHLHSRYGALRFEPKAALLLCLTCHERVTGRVNDRLLIIGTVFWSFTPRRQLIDARAPVRFVKASD